jgi:hypothetical protein
MIETMRILARSDFPLFEKKMLEAGLRIVHPRERHPLDKDVARATIASLASQLTEDFDEVELTPFQQALYKLAAEMGLLVVVEGLNQMPGSMLSSVALQMRHPDDQDEQNQNPEADEGEPAEGGDGGDEEGHKLPDLPG